MQHSSPYPAIRKASPLASPLSEAGSKRSATETAQKFAGHRLQDFPQMPRKLSRADRLAALDELMSDFDRKADWVAGELHQALRKDKRTWSINFLPHQRAELVRIIAYLQARDPVLRRAIIADLIEWHGANDHILTIWFCLTEGGDRD